MFKVILLFVIINLNLQVEGTAQVAVSSSTPHQLSLYEEICCNSSNTGQRIIMEDNNSLKIVFCSSVVPTVCNQQGEIMHLNSYLNSNLYVILLQL